MGENEKTTLIADIKSGRISAMDAVRLMSTNKRCSLGAQRTCQSLIASGAPVDTTDALRIAERLPLAQLGYRW